MGELARRGFDFSVRTAGSGAWDEGRPEPLAAWPGWAVPISISPPPSPAFTARCSRTPKVLAGAAASFIATKAFEWR